MYKKIVAGSNTRKTRLHDERGNMISSARLVRNGPKALVSGFARLAFGILSNRPWISYDMQNVIEKFLNSKKMVLEYGSGMSTLWYAQRSHLVVSVEDDKFWFEKNLQRFSDYKSANIEYKFCGNPEEYTNAQNFTKNKQFDLIMIDGSYRYECALQATEIVAPGGLIYLDNCDKSDGGQSGAVKQAREVLEAFAKQNNHSIQYITDFAPGQFFVQQGLLVRLNQQT
ncbi:MAG: hypothetical protein ACRD5H_01455 [Nitrososphaerales archaeon]